MDDLVLYSKADLPSAHSILHIFNFLSVQSSQRVKLSISKIIFSNNVSSNSRATLSSTLNIPSSSSFGKYLGFPMPNMHPKYSDYQYILDRMNNHLQGWKTKFLTLAGCTTLVWFVLNSIPIMQNHLLPQKTRDHIDRIQRNFLWGSTGAHKKFIWSTGTLLLLLRHVELLSSQILMPKTFPCLRV